MLDLVNKDFSDAERVDILLDTWDREGEPRHQQRISSLIEKFEGNHSEKIGAVKSVGLGTQVMTMFRRHSLLAFRDPTLFTGRAFMYLFTTIFFAIIYISSRHRIQEEIISRAWYVIWIIGCPSCMGVVAVYAYNAEFVAIKREVRNGMVSPVSYLLTNTLLTIPVVFIFALFGIAIGAYGMLAFNGERFGQVLLIYALQMFAYESIAQLFAVATDNFLLGMMNFMNIWFCSFLFSGLFVKLENITWPFRIFAYILPLRYAAESIVYQEFNYQNWNNAHLCDPSSSTEDCNTYGGSGANAGWYCDADIEPCMGSSGQQVLQSLAARFYTYTKNDNTNLNMALLLAIAVGAKIGYVVIMTIKCNAVTKITDSVKTE
ncbi:ABC-2 type transporter-domain-containing protein [Ochromonadaceae sp. CCMP2298]|nr:ABC-2 type transporter-domain-containing protein [Ochromonadaceae sp. CCMP2298]